MINQAKNLIASGVNVVPLIDLRPALKWSQYQDKRQDLDFADKHFASSAINGLALICGKVSGRPTSC